MSSHNRKIVFNKPYMIGKEVDYIADAVSRGYIAGNGHYTRLCQSFFETRFQFHKCLLTTSCSDALEMASILLNITSGDEVIIPSYTFVSTANAFIMRGARIIFADSYATHPNIDPESIEKLITKRTKAIVVVHYAGVACDMDRIIEIAQKHDLFVVEDAAQAIDSYYKGRPLGSFGHLATFSFHETKNIISGEGGMLVVNDPRFEKRAEIIWEKGTNRTAFFKGEVDKYGWVDVGSSFLPSEIVAAFLYAQLEKVDEIQHKRIDLWETYYEELKSLAGKVELPFIPQYASNNGHMFYLVCREQNQRDQLIQFLKSNNVHAVFHYLSLHQSPYYFTKHDGRELPSCDRFANTLVRLPFYFQLDDSDQHFVIEKLYEFFRRS